MQAPNILLGIDAGETAYIDGIVYKKLADQPQLGIPTKSIQSGDVLGVTVTETPGRQALWRFLPNIYSTNT